MTALILNLLSDTIWMKFARCFNLYALIKLIRVLIDTRKQQMMFFSTDYSQKTRNEKDQDELKIQKSRKLSAEAENLG